jgi:hypothetical protein
MTVVTVGRVEPPMLLIVDPRRGGTLRTVRKVATTNNNPVEWILLKTNTPLQSRPAKNISITLISH